MCSEFLVETNFQRKNETNEDKFNRLFTEDNNKKDKLNELKSRLEDE